MYKYSVNIASGIFLEKALCTAVVDILHIEISQASFMALDVYFFAVSRRVIEYTHFRVVVKQ